MNTDFSYVLNAIRGGEAVRIVNAPNTNEIRCNLPNGHLMVAAERGTTEALSRLIHFADGPPVFATTRDRLEQLGLVGAPFAEEETGDISVGNGSSGQPISERMAAVQLSNAAAHLSGKDAEQAGIALRGLTVRCCDWGGVVNCPRVYEAAVDLSRMAGLAPAAVICREAAKAQSATQDDDGKLTVSIPQLVEHRRARATITLFRHGPRVRMPTRYGKFTLQAYEDFLTGHLHLALWTGRLEDPVLTRVHSECLTGDLFGSLRCDCGPQLDRALARLTHEGNGLLVYLRQEGRGIGLINKLRTYAIQDRGFDTVEANEQIGFAADLRDYSLAAQILADLGISAIRLLTNNPQKVRGLKKHGIQIADRVPLVVPPTSENVAYLDVKRTKLGHWLP